MIVSKKILIGIAFISLAWLGSWPAFSFNLSCLDGERPVRRNYKNVININLGAAVVLGLAFQRLHLPFNYERVMDKNKSMVIGFHPAISLNTSTSREAFGTSLRIRSYRGSRAPRGFWRELGVWGIYQCQGSSREGKGGFSRTYGHSMGGVLGDFGYKFIIPDSNLIIEPFLGMALPLLAISKKKTKILGWPFPWAGLSLGYAF